MSDKLWRKDGVQFPRLIAELETVGAFTPDVYAKLCEAMDLMEEEISELIGRAQMSWERIKGNLSEEE